MKEIKLSEIVIPGLFRNSIPRKEKIERVRKYIYHYGKVDKPITLNGRFLVDGYIRYLVAMELEMDTIPFIRTLDSKKVQYNAKETVSFITGKFSNSQKEYIWKNDKNIKINIGDKVLVKSNDYTTGNYNGIVTVVNMFQSNDPSMLRHKSVIRKIG